VRRPATCCELCNGGKVCTVKSRREKNARKLTNGLLEKVNKCTDGRVQEASARCRCTCASGCTALIASGKPLRPSTTAIKNIVRSAVVNVAHHPQPELRAFGLFSARQQNAQSTRSGMPSRLSELMTLRASISTPTRSKLASYLLDLAAKWCTRILAGLSSLELARLNAIADELHKVRVRLPLH
jgi:hypothetical protein